MAKESCPTCSGDGFTVQHCDHCGNDYEEQCEQCGGDGMIGNDEEGGEEKDE